MSGLAGLFPSGAIARGAAWLDGTGPESDVVISSRVRLARNLAGMPFVNRCDAQQRLAVMAACRGQILAAFAPASCAGEGHGQRLGNRVSWHEVQKLSQPERTLLVERHLISKEHAKGAEPRAVALSVADDRLAIMVNEEDHLRLQVLRSGLALADAHAQIDEVDDRIEAGIAIAYLPRFGYLTACPTNVGVAMRMSVMVHLPALRLTGAIEKAREAAKAMSLAVRGFYGEGSDATGDLYQVSNQTTLGKSESMILHELERDLLPLVQYERMARRELMETRRPALDDQLFRALGTLRYARLLAPEEALGMLSLVRMGVLMGLLPGISEQAVTQLVLLTQPAHLQRLLGREMDQQQRRQARADLVRERLGV